MPPTHNATGRNRFDSKHVRLDEYLLDSDAYRSLSPYARSLLVEFKRRYNGRNNGEIHMSVREAAGLLNCSDKTAGKALADLKDRGFVRIKTQGSFGRKVRHATEWTLTEHPLQNRAATKDFMRWKEPSKKSEEKSTVVNFTGVGGTRYHRAS